MNPDNTEGLAIFINLYFFTIPKQISKLESNNKAHVQQETKW